ncbi:hypothetical protein SESBI_44262 [Sesbania bispinosa]|nr:hypothetical protein SESBI_44262 [Sesbania bispinosa]
MKLLGWMHRKFRQNSTEPFKDLVIGQGALDDELNYTKPNFGSKHVKQTQNQKDLQHNLRKSFAGFEDDDYEEEPMYEVFHGFLAIGTLGSEQIVTDPSTTPTFAISVENITEKEDEVTENELKLINDELEKVLGAETNKEDGRSSMEYSSGRNSHVSNGRSSHGSIITLSGKPILEGTESNGNNGSATCPLQGYLFGSAIELSETTSTVAKKEHRTSLGELFQRSKLAEEADKKEADKSATAMHLMKKKLIKKRTSSRSSTSSSAGPVDSASAEKKLHKILHMFNRKVHPENSIAGEKCDKYQKNENKKKTMNEGGHNKSEVAPHTEEYINIMIHPKRALAKEKQYKSQSNPLQFTLGNENSSENKEHWIKTDADYLVLEL